jgi:alpha-tubulin suppressor-like RCC1 family protein
MKKLKKLSLATVLILVLLLSMSVTVFAQGESGSILSSDYDNTFVIKDDGSLWGWGGSYTGNGTGFREPTVTPVKILDNVRSVSSASHSTIAVKKDDTLWAWGYFDGYVDNKLDPKFLSPTKILDDVKTSANGDNYILVLKNDNTLWLCGDMYIGDGTDTKADTDIGFVKIMNGVKSMHAGTSTVYVIKDDDTLWGWGDNSDAQLGNMTDTGDTSTDAETTATFILDDVKFVSNSGSVVIAVRLDGSLYSWGTGGSDGIYTENGWVKNAGSPYKVMDDVVMGTMCKGGGGLLVVKTDGTLWGWVGEWYNEGDQNKPYKYADNVAYVSNGERHAAVVKKDGSLFTMGGNYRYGLGYDSDEIWHTPLTKVLSNVQDAPANWAMEEVEKAIGLQLIPENMQGNYTKSITREEFCILAIRMIEVKSNMDIEDYISVRGLEMKYESPFIDCDNEDVIAANVLNIVNGTSSTTFDPYNKLTREQAAKVLSATARAIGQDITANTPNYADVNDIADWAKPYTGYVYNISVMKGVGGNKFDPESGYQRQQAYMTMYRLFKAIDQVSMEKVEEVEKETEMLDVSDAQKVEISQLRKDIEALKIPDEFYMYIEGTTTDDGYTMDLKYDVFYKNADIRIDTSWDDMIVSSAIYNSVDDATYIESYRYTGYAEYTSGNLLPIRLINIDFLEQLEIDDETELFTAQYEMLNNKNVLYIKTSIKNGVTTEMWYSLEYLVPVKFRETCIEEGITEEINWYVVEIDDTPLNDDEVFDIPDDATINNGDADDYYEDTPVTGSTRDLLLYEVSYIDIEEQGIDDMVQIFYYSDMSYEILVEYFKDLLEGTEGYSVSVGAEMTAIDGTLNGDTVIVIVNNYKEYEPEVGKNGVNINYY